MIMSVLFAVLFLPARFFAANFPAGQQAREQNKKPTRLQVGRNFFFTALPTNSPLAPYSGGTQNRNQYA
jgi:hypothetical protein